MEIKIVSFNIHKGIGWKTRKPTILAIQEQLALINPDIIFLQEIRGKHIDILNGGEFSHICYGMNKVYTNGNHGNAILSNLPITNHQNIDLSCGKIDKRGLLYAVIQPKTLTTPIHLLCLHLGLFQRDRIIQVNKIINFINSHIPKHEPLILGGDFNDWTGTNTKPLIEQLALTEVFKAKNGEYAKTFPAWAPLLKLDRIYHRGFDTLQCVRIIQKPWLSLSDHVAIEARLKLK